MDQLILHSYRRCPFAIRVRMVLEEKRIPYEVVEENLSQLSPELLALHPEGKVPLLVHHVEGKSNVLYQSSVITEYLNEVYPQTPLMPTMPLSRAQVRLWTYWCDSLFKPDLDLYKYERPQLSEEQTVELLARLNQLLHHWNDALSKTPFLMGEEMTLADIHLFPFARQFFAIKPVFPGLESFTFLAQWLIRILERPSFARVIQKRN